MGPLGLEPRLRDYESPFLTFEIRALAPNLCYVLLVQKLSTFETDPALMFNSQRCQVLPPLTVERYDVFIEHVEPCCFGGACGHRTHPQIF